MHWPTYTINAANDGKVGCNTVKYTTVFLHSDWLYLLWNGAKQMRYATVLLLPFIEHVFCCILTLFSFLLSFIRTLRALNALNQSVH